MNLLDAIETTLKHGASAICVTGNTQDRFFRPDDANSTPLLLDYAIAAHLGTKGFKVGRLAGSRIEEFSPPGNKAQNPMCGTTPNSAAGALEHARHVMGRMRSATEPKLALIIPFADLKFPECNGPVLVPEQVATLVALLELARHEGVRVNGNVAILVCHRSGLHSSLLTAFPSIPATLPEFDTRKEFLERILKANGSLDLHDQLTTDETARLTNGLRLLDLQRLTSAPISKASIGAVKKDGIKAQTGGLCELVDPGMTFSDMAGNAAQKECLSRAARLLAAGSVTTPARILLAGPPGNGKSTSFPAMCHAAGLPGLIVRNLHSKYVGESEANIGRLLELIPQISPCLILVEEIDLWIGSRNGNGESDAGTTARMSQRFLEASGSSSLRGKVLWVATTNRPDRLDEAMRDRFGYVVPFLHPSREELPELIGALAAALKCELAPELDFEEIVKLPGLEISTARGISEIVSAAALRAAHEANKVSAPIYTRHLLEAAKDWRPTYDRIGHEFLALTTVKLTPFKSNLPWVSFDGSMRPGALIPIYLRGIVSEETGEIEEEKLDARLDQLQRQLQGRRWTA